MKRHLNQTVIQLLILNCSLLILSSCSVSKQIAKSANENVLSNKALTAAHVGISIFDPAAGKYLYNYQGDKYFVPASNTKIPTCYAAMKYLGDSLIGLRYHIVNDSFIKIKSTGDPSFLHEDFKRNRVYDFLKKFKYISFTESLFEEDFMGSGWTWNDFQEYYSAQRSNFPIYGNVVKFRWVNEDSLQVIPDIFHNSVAIHEKLIKGFEVIKPWEENVFNILDGNEKSKVVPFRPDNISISSLLTDTLHNLVTHDFDKEGLAQSSELVFEFHPKIIRVPNLPYYGSYQLLRSQPLDSLLKPMMHRSDNFFAEQSLLMVSNEMLGVMNDAKIIDTILKIDFKDLPQKPRWADGSGLSRYNLFTPQSFVAILNKMKNEFGMERIKVIFPTGGEGTISSYYKAESGFIFAKTGTLSGVVAFSGFLYTKKGKLLIFSTLVNNHQATATEVRRAMEKFLHGIRNNY